jgi:hypothetical protein
MSYVKNTQDLGKLGITSKPSRDWSTLQKTYPRQFNLVHDKVVEIKTLTVHRFQVGDVEDPDLYAGQPLYEWEQSEMGQWVMSHAVDQPEWRRNMNISLYGYEYIIVAKLTARDYTFWQLKWGSGR